MKLLVPVCFYPTQKLVLDDDEIFSQYIFPNLHGENFLSYHSPNAALNYLLNEYQPTLAKNDIVINNSSILDSDTQHVINIDIKKMQHMLTTSQFPDISVLFVDYHMPDMQGTDFLKQIEHLSIKKALITGESDYKIAVDAFNSGLVDAYLRKDDPDFSDKIQKIISELEWKYFIELSSFAADINDFHFLKNKHFISAFRQFIQKNDVTSFCLTHVQGNFLTQNAQGKQNYILVRNKNDLLALSKIAEEDGGHRDMIEKLRQGKVIPFFGTKDYWQIPASEWNEFIYPAFTLPGDQNLVWTIIHPGSESAN